MDIFEDEERVTTTTTTTKTESSESNDSLVRAFGRLGDRIEQSLVTFSNQIRSHIDVGNTSEQSFFISKANKILTDSRRANRRNTWIIGAMMTAVVLVIALMSYKQEKLLTETLAAGGAGGKGGTVSLEPVMMVLGDNATKLEHVGKMTEQVNATLLAVSDKSDKKADDLLAAVKAIPLAGSAGSGSVTPVKPKPKAHKHRGHRHGNRFGHWVFVPYQRRVEE